ncbi:hypothetical protein ACLOJK_019807 [Asimina triloba]
MWIWPTIDAAFAWSSPPRAAVAATVGEEDGLGCRRPQSRSAVDMGRSVVPSARLCLPVATTPWSSAPPKSLLASPDRDGFWGSHDCPSLDPDLSSCSLSWAAHGRRLPSCVVDLLACSSPSGAVDGEDGCWRRVDLGKMEHRISVLRRCTVIRAHAVEIFAI